MKYELTKNSKRLLKALYGHYKKQRKKFNNEFTCRYMGNSVNIQKNIFPQYTLEDIENMCQELHRADFIKARYADDMPKDIYLSDKSIILFENRIKKLFKDFINFILKIKNIF